METKNTTSTAIPIKEKAVSEPTSQAKTTKKKTHTPIKFGTFQGVFTEFRLSKFSKLGKSGIRLPKSDFRYFEYSIFGKCGRRQDCNV